LVPDGYSWSTISHSRQQGYVEGFDDGQFSLLNGADLHPTWCVKPTSINEEPCIVLQWISKTLIGQDTGETLTTMTKFYSEPRNLCVHWSHAVVIAEAMMSGVPVTEEQLTFIREFDARESAKMRNH